MAAKRLFFPIRCFPRPRWCKVLRPPWLLWCAGSSKMTAASLNWVALDSGTDAPSRTRKMGPLPSRDFAAAPRDSSIETAMFIYFLRNKRGADETVALARENFSGGATSKREEKGKAAKQQRLRTREGGEARRIGTALGNTTTTKGETACLRKSFGLFPLYANKDFKDI